MARLAVFKTLWMPISSNFVLSQGCCCCWPTVDYIIITHQYNDSSCSPSLLGCQCAHSYSFLCSTFSFSSAYITYALYSSLKLFIGSFIVCVIVCIVILLLHHAIFFFGKPGSFYLPNADTKISNFFRNRRRNWGLIFFAWYLRYNLQFYGYGTVGVVECHHCLIFWSWHFA